MGETKPQPDFFQHQWSLLCQEWVRCKWVVSLIKTPNNKGYCLSYWPLSTNWWLRLDCLHISRIWENTESLSRCLTIAFTPTTAVHNATRYSTRYSFFKLLLLYFGKCWKGVSCPSPCSLPYSTLLPLFNPPSLSSICLVIIIYYISPPLGDILLHPVLYAMLFWNP